MALMEWNDRFGVGIKSIDEQHMKMIGMINTLFDALSEGKGNQALAGVLDELVTYTKTHFAYEELLFVQHGYPDAAQHKAEHDSLTAQVADIREQMQEGKIGLGITTMTFLKDWLTVHIMGSDKKYGPF